MLVQNRRGCLAQMIDAYNSINERANVIAVEEVTRDRVHMYGVVGVGKPKGNAFAITGDGGKAEAGGSTSNLIITGRYILQPEILDILTTQATGAGGEIQSPMR